MFYEFSQNNSGGGFHFDYDAGISEYVIIEAHDSDHANRRALEIGLYFNGCDTGDDCPCCGDRWSAAWVNEGEDEPKIYGVPLHKATASWSRSVVFVHHLSGYVSRHDLKGT